MESIDDLIRDGDTEGGGDDVRQRSRRIHVKSDPAMM